MLSRAETLVSRDESLVSRDESLVSRDESLVSQDAILVSQEGGNLLLSGTVHVIVLVHIKIVMIVTYNLMEYTCNIYLCVRNWQKRNF